MAKKPEQILKTLKTLLRTQRRLMDWAKNKKTEAWTVARKQIYNRAQEASKIIRDKSWVDQFNFQDRAEIKRLYSEVRENILFYFPKLEKIQVDKKKKNNKRKKPSARVPTKRSSK